MKTIKLFLLIVTIGCVYGCSQKDGKKPAQIRCGQFLLSNGPVHISLSRKGTELYSADVGYASLTQYQDFPAGTYVVNIKNNGKLILSKKIGMGAGGTYTLSLYGIPLENQKTNQRSTGEQLHRITEGAAAETANGYLPKLTVMNDYFTSGKDEAKIQIVNLAPGIKPISASVHASGKKKVSFSKVPYPKTAKKKSLPSGSALLQLNLNKSRQEIGKTDFKAEKEHLYTFFIIPQQDSYLKNLQIVEGVSPKQH